MKKKFIIIFMILISINIVAFFSKVPSPFRVSSYKKNTYVFILLDKFSWESNDDYYFRFGFSIEDFNLPNENGIYIKKDFQNIFELPIDLLITLGGYFDFSADFGNFIVSLMSYNAYTFFHRHNSKYININIGTELENTIFSLGLEIRKIYDVNYNTLEIMKEYEPIYTGYGTFSFKLNYENYITVEFSKPFFYEEDIPLFDLHPMIFIHFNKKLFINNENNVEILTGVKWMENSFKVRTGFLINL
ncbi:hypothetical protein XO10_07950 [Marinitoga sp. 1135]|uniref:Uncharacterized protein n=1 Tax=Marinitoga piezophila (strain DSM 14283 / JCM 11233 / KA3) TaxID=443254 RepID=H2J4Y5_MARPK|nr:MULTISPECIES: hypothetical protein [Marinitoga]AEX86002.1 hypothetical protein Marpi_1613 [Marinitoga piezophila KA3]APT76424.1 hypothetical protein LN42_08570 [Marinitoga sp. 1137]NUU96192.1 hypothetical protein [Marinitoga sp. 1135]NUU98100.1 hypothetical protein [Marinitoga sp. 1138]